MSNDTLNPMANMKAGVLADLTANGDRLNEIAQAHADSQKASSSDRFTLRDKTPLTEISDETVRKAVEAYRKNVEALNAEIKKQKETIAPVLGISETDDFDKESARKEYLDLKARRTITIAFATKTDLLSEDEVKALPAVKSWGGGTVSDAAAAAMRPRFSEMTITKDGKSENVKPATSGELSKVLNKKNKGTEGWSKVSSSDLTGLFVGAAPNNDLKKADSVTITVGGYEIVAKPTKESASATPEGETTTEDAPASE